VWNRARGENIRIEFFAPEKSQEVRVGGDAQDVRLGGGPPVNSRAGPTHNAFQLGNLAARERAGVLRGSGLYAILPHGRRKAGRR
jgi:hypothetical protein